MTVTYLSIKPQGRSGRNDSRVRTYTDVHKLESSVLNDTPYNIGSNVNLPFIGQAHAEDPLAYCNGLTPTQINGQQWEVTVNWTTANSIDGEAGQDEDPTQDRPILTWNGSTQNISIWQDRDNSGILNSAGDSLLDVMDSNLLGVTISSNVESVPSYILSYRNSINNAAITVGGLNIAAGVARVVFPGGFISPIQVRNDFSFYTFTYELMFDEQESHEGKLLDQGYNERYTDENVTDGLRPITLDGQQDITEPALLDGSGVRLEDPTPATAQYITVNKYFQKDFSVLPGVTAT
jgi:hypothetical protein